MFGESACLKDYDTEEVMTVKEQLDARAKECGFDYAKKIGVYKGYEVWLYDTKRPAAVGYPIFALVKDRKVWTIGYGDKYHRRIWDFVIKGGENESAPYDMRHRGKPLHGHIAGAPTLRWRLAPTDPIAPRRTRLLQLPQSRLRWHLRWHCPVCTHLRCAR